MKISASFLSIKKNIEKSIQELGQTDIDFFHLDIMDGLFVPNKTFNITEISHLFKNIKQPIDIHLMVEDVLKYINEFKILSPKYITFHLEAVQDPNKIINYLNNLNIKVGLALKPNTNIETITPFLNKLDLILVMSVEPGMGGQKFIKSIIPKIKKLKQLKNKFNYKYIIQVDGGINDKTVKFCSGADLIVVGSFITNSSNYNEQVNKLKEKINEINNS